MPTYSVCVGIQETYSLVLEAENINEAENEARERIFTGDDTPINVETKVSVVETKGLVGSEEPKKEGK